MRKMPMRCSGHISALSNRFRSAVFIRPTYSDFYPSGHWLFGFASEEFHPIRDMNAVKWNALGLKTRYYNTQLHAGAFALPNYVEMMRDVE